MKRALLALWLIGAIVYTTNGASAQPVETASIQSEQAEVHSVVVDTPQVISLQHASPEAWDTLPSSVQLDEQLPATGQAAQTSPDLNEIELLKVNSVANIRSGASASAEIIGIAHAGAEVQVASRDSGWVRSMVMEDRMDLFEVLGTLCDTFGACGCDSGMIGSVAAPIATVQLA